MLLQLYDDTSEEPIQLKSYIGLCVQWGIREEIQPAPAECPSQAVKYHLT